MALWARIPFVLLKLWYFEFVRNLNIWNQTEVCSILSKQILSSESLEFLLHLQKLFLELVQSFIHASILTWSVMIYLSSLRGKSMHNRSWRSHDSRSWYLRVLLCETHCRCSWNFNFQRFVTLRWTHIHGDFWSFRSWRYVPFWNKVIQHAPRSIRRHGILRNRRRNKLGNHSPLWFFWRWSILCNYQGFYHTIEPFNSTLESINLFSEFFILLLKVFHSFLAT